MFQTSGNRIEAFKNSSNNILLLKKVFREVRKIFKVIKLSNSFFNIDIIVNKKGVFVIDLNLLLDSKIDRFLYFLGVDIYSLQIDLVSKKFDKKTVDLIRKNTKQEGAMRFIYDQSLANTLERKGKDTDQDIVYESLIYVDSPPEKLNNKVEQTLPAGILLGRRQFASKIWIKNTIKGLFN